MRVVHFSEFDIKGGAARAAWRVHDSLRSAGVDSSMVVAARESHDPGVEQFVPRAGICGRLARVIRRDLFELEMKRASHNKPSGFDGFRDDRAVYGSEVAAAAPDADIYHLHQITD